MSVNATTVLPPLPADVTSKTGPRLIGYLFHWGLFGVLSTQVYMYYLAFPKDPLRNKLVVYGIYVLELLQTIIITASAFHVFAAGYGNFAYYNGVELAWFSVPILSGVVAWIAEIFYAYRIMLLSESYWVSGVIVVLAFVQLGGAIAGAVVLKRAALFSNLLGPHFFITSGIWNGGSALCDVIIAVCMTYYLSRKGADGMKDTQVMLRKIIMLIIETGSATAIIAILNLILVLLPSRPSFYQVPSEIMAKVYSNSLLVLLNSRMRIGLLSSDETTDRSSMATRRRTGRRTGEMSEGFTLTELGTTHSAMAGGFSVKVETEEQEMRDPVPKAYFV